VDSYTELFTGSRHYQTYGAEGLLDKLPGCKGAHPNRVAPEIEQAILDYSLTRPTHGRCGSPKNWLCKASMSVRVVCVVCGNVTTCSPNTTVCLFKKGLKLISKKVRTKVA
jgi:hypothetical protein